MGQAAKADLGHMAVELYYLREEAKAAGEPFLAYLIEMAAKEAERMGGESKPDRRKPQLVYAAGEAEKPGG